MIHVLREFYGLQPTPPADLFQFLVWEILSHNALPARRDLAWQALKKIPALTPDAMFRAPSKDLLDALGIAGAHREEKLELIRATVGEFKRHRHVLYGETLRQAGLLRARRALKHLPHVPLPTRSRALLFAAGYEVLPIDAEMMRVAGRLMGQPDTRHRPAVRRWLMARVSAEIEALRDAVVYLRHHARNTCVPVAPHCGVCPLRADCASAMSTTDSDK